MGFKGGDICPVAASNLYAPSSHLAGKSSFRMFRLLAVGSVLPLTPPFVSLFGSFRTQLCEPATLLGLITSFEFSSLDMFSNKTLFVSALFVAWALGQSKIAFTSVPAVAVAGETYKCVHRFRKEEKKKTG